MHAFDLGRLAVILGRKIHSGERQSRDVPCHSPENKASVFPLCFLGLLYALFHNPVYHPLLAQVGHKFIKLAAVMNISGHQVIGKFRIRIPPYQSLFHFFLLGLRVGGAGPNLVVAAGIRLRRVKEKFHVRCILVILHIIHIHYGLMAQLFGVQKIVSCGSVPVYSPEVIDVGGIHLIDILFRPYVHFGQKTIRHALATGDECSRRRSKAHYISRKFPLIHNIIIYHFHYFETVGVNSSNATSLSRNTNVSFTA